MKEDRKKIFLRTFGCQMNFRDSELVKGILTDQGFQLSESPAEADVVLFNTCSVRRHAEDRAYNNIRSLQVLKQKRPDMIIGVIGCMAQVKGENIFLELPHVDFTCGPDNEQDLPGLIKNILKERTNVAALGKIGQEVGEVSSRYRDDRLRALVSISRGCNNFCSYCIVPFARGRERSRGPKAILREVRELAEAGFKEVTLLGQNVNSYNGYGDRKDAFVRLLEDINKIEGIERIRFTTSHPKDTSIELFKAMRDLSKVCEHLHLPLQSGSDRILTLMNRGYTAGFYMKVADNYRRLLPHGSITTDIIVGFPSETEKDFQKTQALMNQIEFDSSFIFKYSPRPPAKATCLKDDVPEDVKAERNNLLLELQRTISRKRNQALLGSRQEVLFEGWDKKSRVRLTGRTRTNKIVVTDGDRDRIGQLCDVYIERVTCQTLMGKVAK